MNWKLMYLQDSGSPLMEQLTFFHDHAMVIITIITILVGQLMVNLLFNKLSHRFLLEGQLIELIWTILPALILISIAIPSLSLIYMIDEIQNPCLSLKSIGHQWYWSYEYSDFKNIEFDSYMTPPQEMNTWSFRLMDVDNRLIIPFKTQIRILITSSDVIHAWTIPSLGIKLDATPGRLNQSSMIINRPGIFYGQCSEICGANHSFMPIVLESISPNYFLKWMNNY